jgi:ABC-2 type transport system ATP-binding protein
VATAQPVLRAQALSKSYGNRLAVDGLDLEVDRAELFGFLGPNGAGKTTTIRMALGLIAPTAGSVEILGQEVRSHRAQVLPRVGALVESPALYGYMSGRDNLRAVGSILGRVSEKRLDEVLDIVSLKGRDRDKVKTYSMGMKQRLGLAIALLNDPELLILDEPANGLDPAGIVEMRDLLRRLVAEDKTVFLSSHVLSEVQQTCTRVAIINHGKLVRVAPVAELLAGAGEFAVRVDAPAEVVAALRQQPWGHEARAEDGLVITRAPDDRGRNLIEFLVGKGLTPDSVSERQRDLEDIFLSLTGGETVE